MVQIAGKYENISNENFVQYIKSLGPEASDELATKMDAARPVIEIDVNGNECSIKSSSGRSQTFTFGQTFADEIFPGSTVQSTAVLEGNKVNITSVSSDNRSGNRTYEFTDSGLTVHYLGNTGVSAKRVYKRL